MSAVTAAVLGVVQGVTEFLPISSSAHLILARGLLGWDAGEFGLAFDVACHVGTLVAVIAYFRQTLVALAQSGLDVLQGRGAAGGRQLVLLAVGSVPVAVVGLAFSGLIEERLRTPGVAAVALAVGALCFLAVERRDSRDRLEESLSVGEALAIGVGQAMALVPGVSRSGATIVVGLFFGLRREAAARFGFLLGMPAIMAATAREALVLGESSVTTEVAWLFGIGAVTSGVVGYVTVRYLMRYLVGHSLHTFAYYRLVVAALVPVAWLVAT